MPRRITYLNYILPLLAGLLLLAGWFSLRLWQAGAKEQALFRLSVSASSAQTRTAAASESFRQAGRSGTFSAEILEQMDALPGLRRRWALYCADVEIEIDKYHTDTELCGVEMSEYPLTVIQSTGERQTGTRPLLIAGKDFFGSLSDEYGNSISERQTEILKEQIGSLAVRLTVQEAAGAGVSAGRGEEDDLTGNKRNDRPQDAEFLGIAKESGLYMDAEQMRRWLAQLGLPCEIRRVELEIQGERNAQKAQGSLEKSGFLVERGEQGKKTD